MPVPLIVGAATCEIETIVQEAQCSHPDPGTSPPNRLFMLEEVQSKVLDHSSRFIRRPWAQQALQVPMPAPLVAQLIVCVCVGQCISSFSSWPPQAAACS